MTAGQSTLHARSAVRPERVDYSVGSNKKWRALTPPHRGILSGIHVFVQDKKRRVLFLSSKEERAPLNSGCSGAVAVLVKKKDFPSIEVPLV